jgi:hypothetical protein
VLRHHEHIDDNGCFCEIPEASLLQNIQSFSSDSGKSASDKAFLLSLATFMTAGYSHPFKSRPTEARKLSQKQRDVLAGIVNHSSALRKSESNDLVPVTEPTKVELQPDRG